MSDFGSLDLSNVHESGGGEQRKTIPPGNHAVTITEAKVQSTKAGGKALYVKLENDEGQYVTDYLNFVHKTSQQAVDIGKRRMKEMLVCGGHPTPDKPGSVEKIKGLKLGARVVQGPDWKDTNGEVRPGKGELRSTAPFFKLDDASVTLGEAPRDDQMFGKKDSDSDTTEIEDSEIPF